MDWWIWVIVAVIVLAVLAALAVAGQQRRRRGRVIGLGEDARRRDGSSGEAST